MNSYFLITILGLIDVNWSDIIDPIHDMFRGTNEMQGIIGNSDILIGAFIFVVLFLMTLMWGLGMLMGAVVIIPTLFAIFNYIPNLRILVAIILGLLFGIGLHQLIRR